MAALILAGQPARVVVDPGTVGVDMATRPEAMPSLLRNGYALMVNTAVTALLGFAYWLIAARLYPAAAVGAGGAAVSALLLVAGISQLNLMGAITRFLPVAGSATARFLKGAYAITAGCSVVIGTIAVTTAGWWAPDDSPLRTSGAVQAVFVLGVAVWCLFVLQDSALTAVRRAVVVPIENGLFGVAKIALLVALAVKASGTGILVSWVMPAAAAIVPVNLLLFRRFIPARVRAQPEATFPLAPSTVARFVAGDYLGSLFSQGLLSLMPLLVVAMLGSTAGGHFYVAWTIAMILDLLTSNLATSMTVEGALAESRLPDYGRAVLRRVATVLVPASIGIVACAGLVLAVFGSDYEDKSAVLLRLLALATLPRALSSLFVGMCRVQRRVSRIAAVQGAQAVLVLGLAAALMPSLGIAGAGVAALVGHSVVGAAVIPSLRRALRAGRGVEE